MADIGRRDFLQSAATARETCGDLAAAFGFATPPRLNSGCTVTTGMAAPPEAIVSRQIPANLSPGNG
jgi:hypothetical protein